ncbi:MAG: hypothetical protein EPN73_02270 [Paraburkholderia sp.]|uniref:hypothetical protein n=1 Tax=Paraburkholderia sp. TaxID=1926495 RepID=UPI0011FE122B|nr:hypothetical protein [Paraburkholderia sp.]TAL98758.1 MAG: hypothetical protein EPN73_02270 [Paraburkholderia sp.]
MNAPSLNHIAAAIMQAGSSAWPTVLLVREAPIYEVEFGALEFAVEAKLPSCDWAALALARALGEISPADVDSYLGLGDVVSVGIVRRLLDEGLLTERSDMNRPERASAANSGSANFFQRLFGRKPAETDIDAPVGRLPTAARTLRGSQGPVSPRCYLSAGGELALDRGVVAQRRERVLRLQFIAEPLLFLGVEDERKQTYVRHRRPVPLGPDRVPEPLRVLDTTLALSADERLRACGIGASIPGLSGELVGIVPGSQWEVREIHEARQQRPARGTQCAQIILSAVPGSARDSLLWQTFLGLPNGTRACATLDAARLVPEAWFGLPGLLAALDAGMPLPAAKALRRDGALELRCEGALLASLLGDADEPDDALLQASAGQWSAGLRVHGKPAGIEAGRDAFFEFVRRHDADLRNDFDGTCARVATSLITYWEENPGLPSIEDAAINLWADSRLRAALCKRRLHRDLIADYEQVEVVQ